MYNLYLYYIRGQDSLLKLERKVRKHEKIYRAKPVGHETHLLFTLASQNQMLIKTRTLYEVIWGCSHTYVSDKEFNF